MNDSATSISFLERELGDRRKCGRHAFPGRPEGFEDVGSLSAFWTGWSIVYEPEAAVYHSHDFPLDILFKRYFDIGVVYQRLGI